VCATERRHRASPQIAQIDAKARASGGYEIRYSDAAWRGLPSVSGTLPNAQNAEESTPCTLSIKIEPDSRGTSPAMTSVLAWQACALPRSLVRDGRIRSGHVRPDAYAGRCRGT